jgi:hypothetical protein
MNASYLTLQAMAVGQSKVGTVVEGEGETYTVL